MIDAADRPQAANHTFEECSDVSGDEGWRAERRARRRRSVTIGSLQIENSQQQNRDVAASENFVEAHFAAIGVVASSSDFGSLKVANKPRPNVRSDR